MMSVKHQAKITLMRRWQGGLEQPHLCRHQALRAIAEPHEEGVAGLEFGDAVAAQRFHVDEDVVRPVTARD